MSDPPAVLETSRMETMDTVVAISIGVLATVFLGALMVLIVIFRRHSEKEGGYKRSDVCLIESDLEVELGDVRLHPNIEQILADDQWIGDATGLVPHCLAVLKTCHTLTERLATVAMGPLIHRKTGHEIVEVARRISPRVDDVVRSMYPPLDARLLEARTMALVLSVAQLAFITRNGSAQQNMQWVDHALNDMDMHLLVLREAALAQEAACRIQNLMSPNNTSADS